MTSIRSVALEGMHYSKHPLIEHQLTGDMQLYLAESRPLVGSSLMVYVYIKA